MTVLSDELDPSSQTRRGPAAVKDLADLEALSWRLERRVYPSRQWGGSRLGSAGPGDDAPPLAEAYSCSGKFFERHALDIHRVTAHPSVDNSLKTSSFSQPCNVAKVRVFESLRPLQILHMNQRIASKAGRCARPFVRSRRSGPAPRRAPRRARSIACTSGPVLPPAVGLAPARFLPGGEGAPAGWTARQSQCLIWVAL